MSCLSNLRIVQTVNYDSTPDTTNGLLDGQVYIEVLNTYGDFISGEVIVSQIRELPVVDLDDEPITEIQPLTSTGETLSFNFYYPSNEPNNIVVDVLVKIRVGDCFYEKKCTHVLLTPNPFEYISFCNELVQGYEVISGCTNPLYYEYNPNANVDDGSCGTLKPIFGCTNPLAVNYNPLATFNNGTCIFKSGCTNALAINYDSTAVIDDGSCECGDINIQMDFGYSSGETFVVEPNCQYLIEFDLMAEIECGKLIDYLSNDTRTILEVLSELKINAQAHVLTNEENRIIEYTGGTVQYTGETSYLLIQNENLFTFDKNIIPYGIGIYGDAEDCAFINNLISTELQIDCPVESVVEQRFKKSWKRYTFILNSDLIQTFVRFNLNFQNFDFGLCTYIDNLKLSKLCTINQERCVIIPSRYGFEFDKIIDNKKSWVYTEEALNRLYDYQGQDTTYRDFDSRLIFNTKELELAINPVKYIESDVLEYYSYYSRFFSDIDERYTELTMNRIQFESINVIGRQYIRQYPYLQSIYEQYLDGLDCAPSKALDYPYGLEIINRTGDYWYSAVKQLIPATSIWNEAKHILKNNVFHKPKHVYKQYTLGVSSDTDIDSPSGVTIVCNVLSDKCLSENFDTIEGFLSFEFGNVQCTPIYTGGTIGYSGSSGQGNFIGKLIQYSTNENGENTIENIIGFDDYNCSVFDICDETIINPNLSYECLTYVELGETLNTGYAVLSINPAGGQAPYVITGATNGDIVEHGDIINVTIIDSNNCTTSSTITINCPVDCGSIAFTVTLTQDCDTELGENTGFATVDYTIGGGLAPYTIVATANGIPFNPDAKNTFEHGDVIIFSVNDSTLCNTAEAILVINCPTGDCIGEEIFLSANTICDFDEFGYPVGTGSLFIDVSGGTAPYTYFDAFTSNELFNGQTVNNGDSFLIFAVDANGCISETISYTVVCETPCEVATFDNTWEIFKFYPDIFDIVFVSGFRFKTFITIPGAGSFVTTVSSCTITINSIDNGIIYPSAPPSLGVPISTVAINNYSDQTDLYIEYPDGANRVSNINMTINLVLLDGCEYEKTYTLQVDGNGTIIPGPADTYTTGTLTLNLL